MCTINNEPTMVIIPIRDIEEKEREGYRESSPFAFEIFYVFSKKKPS